LYLNLLFIELKGWLWLDKVEVGRNVAMLEDEYRL
jgi:hypothetical protein